MPENNNEMKKNIYASAKKTDHKTKKKFLT